MQTAGVPELTDFVPSLFVPVTLAVKLPSEKTALVGMFEIVGGDGVARAI